MILLVAVVVAAASDAPLFARDEPHLLSAIDALEAGDPDLAIERAHEAVVDEDDERAIVEYDIGQALALRATLDAQAQQQQQQQQQPAPSTPGQPPAPPPPPKFDDAIESFERAAALAKDKRIQSEAHLAVGNAHLVSQKLDDAIAAYRRALVALPQNERARRNLQRALELKKAQPPPPPQQGGGDDEQQKDEDKKDEQQKDEQKDNTDPSSGKNEQKDEQKDAQKDEQKNGDGQKQDSPPDDKGMDKQEQGQPQGGEEPKDQPPPKDGKSPSGAGDSEDKKKADAAAAQAKPKKPTSKEEAKRMLRGLRSRERPLSPLEMRGAEKERPKNGKDW